MAGAIGFHAMNGKKVETGNQGESNKYTIVAILLMALYVICSYYSYYEGYVSGDTLPIAKIALALFLIAGVFVISHYAKISIWIKRSTLGIVALLTVIFIFAGNIEVFDTPAQFPTCLLFTIGIVFLTYAVLGRYACIPLLCIFLEETIRSLCSVYLNITLNAHVLAAVFGTSREEALAFLNFENVSAFILIVAITSLLVYVLVRTLKRERRTRCALFGVFIFGCALLFRFALTPILLNQPSGLWPMSGVKSFARAAYSGYENNKKLLKLVLSLPSSANQPSQISTLKGNEGAICIVHIGESVRADRLSVNGYEKDTTPWLRSQARLISYSRCISAAPETVKAFITILTNGRCNVEYAPDGGYMPTVGSVMDLFAANGITCSSFIGAGAFQEDSDKPFNGILMRMTKSSQKQFFNDGFPILQVDSILNYVASCQNENLFILANNAGSHMPFHLYDETQAPFKPTSKTAYIENPAENQEKGIEANNAYDNTIYMLDMYIQKLITGLKGKPFIYIYVGDHGDYTGQEGVWSRAGLEVPEKYYATSGCIVPMLVYASPEFEALHPHFAEALHELGNHSSMTIAHEHIFHTLLGLFGISTPYYDASLDLCSPKAEPYTGPQPGNSVRLQDGGWH